MKIEQIAASEVELPATHRTARKYAEVYAKAAKLAIGQALRLTFDTDKELLSAYSSLRAAMLPGPSAARHRPNSVAVRRGLVLKRWDIIKYTAAKSVAIIRLPDAEEEKEGTS